MSPKPPEPKIDNRWQDGLVHVVLPPLGRNEIGQAGVRFSQGLLDPRVGEEVILVILDDEAGCTKFDGAGAMDLHAATMVLRTSAGSVALIMWRMLLRGVVVQDVEHPIDLCSADTTGFLRQLARQTRLKVFVRDSRSGATINFFEFDNVYEMGAFADSLEEIAVGEQSSADFAATVAAYQREYAIEDLIAAAFPAT